MRYIITGTLMVLAFVLALKFPDLDQKISFLVHRSIITHGPAIPIIAALVSLKWNRGAELTIAFSLGMVFHLLFDLFPKAWIGFALVHVPFMGRLAPFPSVVWLLSAMLICLVLMFYLIYHRWFKTMDDY